MRVTTELIVVIVAILIFYVRIAILRGQKKRFEREYALKRRKVKGRSKGSPLPEKAPGTPPYMVRSWALVAVSIILMLIGVVAYSKFSVLGLDLIKDAAFVEAYAKYWYLAVSAGVILLGFCVTIEKPRLDE